MKASVTVEIKSDYLKQVVECMRSSIDGTEVNVGQLLLNEEFNKEYAHLCALRLYHNFSEEQFDCEIQYLVNRLYPHLCYVEIIDNVMYTFVDQEDCGMILLVEAIKNYTYADHVWTKKEL
jgi:hypothetical protein